MDKITESAIEEFAIELLEQHSNYLTGNCCVKMAMILML